MMYKTKSRLFLVIMVVMIWIPGRQVLAQDKLKQYIEEGIQNNLVMQQKNISLQRSLLALREAKSWYYPSVEFLGDYMWAEGGRTFPVPVGDLLNPVYATLNQLTQSQMFPQIENQAYQLMPQNFYDARVSILYPVVNTDVWYNSKIKRQQVTLSEYEIETYRQELTKDIETAYYHFCLATDGVAIYKSAFGLVKKNLEVNESLLRNGKGLPANVLRAESELEQIRSRLKEAENQVKNSRSYFNFLLNRSIGDSIIYEDLPLPGDVEKRLAATPKVDKRSELMALGTVGHIRQLELEWDQRYMVPKINIFANFGSQASDWAFDSQSRYFLAGAQLSIPIFEGLRNRVKISKTRLEIDDARSQKELAEKQFNMVANVALNNLNTAIVNLNSADKQYHSAKAYFNLIEKGYAGGINSLIEYMDARNQLTSSEIHIKINRYRVLSAYSELKRQTAGSEMTN
jgi:outer membrane protein